MRKRRASIYVAKISRCVFGALGAARRAIIQSILTGFLNGSSVTGLMICSIIAISATGLAIPWFFTPAASTT